MPLVRREEKLVYSKQNDFFVYKNITKYTMIIIGKTVHTYVTLSLERIYSVATFRAEADPRWGGSGKLSHRQMLK